MNTKRWLLASVAVFVAIGVLEFLIHGVLLSDLYKQTASVWRPEAQMRQMIWIFWVGYLVFAPFFALIYVEGYEKGKPDRKSTRLNSSHDQISYAVFCLKKKTTKHAISL